MTPEREIALNIIEAGLAAIDTKAAVKNGTIVGRDFIKFQDYEVALTGVERIFVVGVGKCALDAATVLEEMLGERLTAGVAFDVREGVLKKIKVYAGTHPLPSEKNVGITRKIIALLAGLERRDLVIFIISGGGSTLLCQPAYRTGRPDNFTYAEEAALIDCLTKSGADIMEVNTVRKHLSLARGGFLAKHAYPAQIVSLIFSDVPGGDLEFVTSGPTVLDTTSVRDAEAILEKYATGVKCDFSGAKLIETPKEEKYFAPVKNIFFVSNELALEAMAAEAKKHGLAARICSTCLRGEARDAGKEVVAAIKNESAGTILLYGGETTVTVRGAGKGGRNLEMALAALPIVKEKEMLVAVASDGRDNTDFAGAIADEITRRKAAELGLDPESFLADNSSFDFWDKTGDFILTGHTGSNVADLVFAIKFKQNDQ